MFKHFFRCAPLAILASPGTAFAQSAYNNPAYNNPAYNNPQGSGPIVSALEWMQGTLLGNVATTAAVIAVAVVGLMMLSGRMNWRFGATVIIGCFILFGATAIVSGIRVTAMGG